MNKETKSELMEAARFAEALDSLHTLPLSIMPIKTPALLKAKMIKNARLQSVIELFEDAGTGSGQVNPSELHGYIVGHDETLDEDIATLERLQLLESFDIYSLRAELRRIGIPFDNFNALQLSPKKRAELTDFMKRFTRPLIQRIYGSDQGDMTDVSQIIAKVANPDRKSAVAELQKMADELQIELLEVPAFLERYGDIFLSLSYFRSCLDTIMDEMPAYQAWADELSETYLIKSDTNARRLLESTDRTLNQISTSIVGRFEVFDQRSHAFWDDINADSFRDFQDLVQAHHVSIGAVLCGLSVKLGLWQDRFANRGGGPNKRLEFIRSEIVPGLERINQIEQRAMSG